jgi:hypothetical protein
VIIGLFETIEPIRQALAKSLTKLLDKYDLRKKNYCLCQDEGFNFNAMTSVLKSIVNCESIGIQESF